MSHDDPVERLGELLVDEGILTHEEIVESVKASGRAGSALGGLLLRSNAVRRRELAVFLAMDVETPSVDLDGIEISPNAVPLVPEPFARKHACVPLERFEGILCVAKSNVSNRAAVLELRRLTGLKVKVFRADEEKVLACIDRVYGAAPKAADLTLPLTGPADAAMAARAEDPEAALREDAQAAVTDPDTAPAGPDSASSEPRERAPDEVGTHPTSRGEAAAAASPESDAAVSVVPAARPRPVNGSGIASGALLRAIRLGPLDAAASADAGEARRALEAWEKVYASGRAIPAVRVS